MRLSTAEVGDPRHRQGCQYGGARTKKSETGVPGSAGLLAVLDYAA